MNYKYLPIAIFLAINSPAYAQMSDLPAADKNELSDKKVSTYSDTEELAPVDVYGETIALDGIMTDEEGYDAVYDDNYSSDFVGKKRIEAYRGTTPSDLLSSFAGIYSGDSRNSGAIDPNIRGVQGEGRVKTRIDGTEQAIAVNRGYNGASSRNYIDPMLTSSIRVVKDSGIDTGVQTGIGGGMEIHTLNVNDFIDKDIGFGGEIRIETSSGATKPRIRDFNEGDKIINMPGMHIDNIDNLDIDSGTGTATFTGHMPKWPPPTDMGWDYFTKPYKERSKKDEYNVFSGEDIAARIALGYKGTNWDVMGAVAIRDRGNYFAGGNAADYYNAPAKSTTNNTTRSLAKYFKPGMDTFNSSNKMTSYLFKASWQPTDEHKLSFKARRSDSIYGEILPQESHAHAEQDMGTQWPLSKVDASTYSLQYDLNPKDNDWVDLSTNLWLTKTKTRAYNSGAGVLGIDTNGTAVWGILDRSHFKSYDPATGVVTWDVSDLLDDTLIDTGYVATKHTRKGIDISNRFKLNDNLNVTAFGSLQKEDIKSDMPFQKRTLGVLTQAPREGRRQEYGVGFNVNWQATDKLTLDVGAQYNSYWMMDDLFDKHIKAGKFTEYQDHEMYYEYKVKTEEGFNDHMSQSGYANCNSAEDCANKKIAEISTDADKQESLDDYNWMNDTDYTEFNDEFIGVLKAESVDYYNRTIEGYDGEDKEIKWEKDSNGRYSLANNPCFDGRANNIEGIVKSKDGCPADLSYRHTMRTISSIEKSKGHQWTPALALNYQVNDNINVYARYNESVRFPSTREGLISFASSPQHLSGGGRLRPEHSRKFELGYVHNLTDYLPSAELADIKLAYYQNNMTDVIDKDMDKRIFNLEKQKTKGLELQGRYDSGKFFSDLGVNYLLENKVCDESTAAQTEAMRGDSPLGHVPQCVQDGFYNTFSLTHAVPKLSTKLHLGTRLLDKKLTLGARFTYYNKVDLDDFNNYLRVSGASEHAIKSHSNPIYGWDKTFLVDAYARYKINKNFSVELSGNNLTDQYFVDPASRTAMPAPGRSFKLGFTGRF